MHPSLVFSSPVTNLIVHFDSFLGNMRVGRNIVGVRTLIIQWEPEFSRWNVGAERDNGLNIMHCIPRPSGLGV